MLFIGPEAERRFGRIHFRDLTAVFTAAPEFTVLSGRTEVGRADPMLLTERVIGPRLLLLGGYSWRVTWIDWKRRRCHVEPADGGGKAGWIGTGTGLVSFELARAARDDPPVALTRRAAAALAAVRDDLDFSVHPGGTVISRSPSGDLRWWTWAGDRANATLKATLRLRGDLRPDGWRSAVRELADHLVLPDVDDRAVHGLKFSADLPRHLAEATLAARLADLDNAARALTEPHRFTTRTG
ncbi:hypothetical protein [Actinomadura madurae]|uniref:hypothetical protein n=1 Tax=Actinomadura madurae TaxID=1993 RepID=UPI000D85202F|nr:Lhr-like helicases [Actinomadura madurae]